MATFQPSAQADHFQPQNTQNWTLEQLNKVTCPNRLCFLLLHEDSQVSCLPGEETATYRMHLGKRPAGLRSIMLSLETSGPLIRMLLLQLPRALTLLRTTCTNCKNCSRINSNTKHLSPIVHVWDGLICGSYPKMGLNCSGSMRSDLAKMLDTDAGSCTAVWYHLNKIVSVVLDCTRTASIFTVGD